jgi:hypothetical protein
VFEENWYHDVALVSQSHTFSGDALISISFLINIGLVEGSNLFGKLLLHSPSSHFHAKNTK